MNREALMKRSSLALPLLGVLFVACAPPSPSTVEEIIAANLEARGGEERLRALGSSRETGMVRASGGRVARVVRETARPGRIRLEFSYQGTVSVFAHDGETAWQVAPLQGQFEPRVMDPDHHAAAGVDQRDLEGPLLDWREKGHVVELAGREALAGGEAFKLKLTLADGAIRYDYIDLATWHVVRSDVTRSIRGRAVELQNTYSDFRVEGGIVFPHLIETRAKDRPEVLTITLETIELDPDLDDARFQYPG